MRMKNPPHPGLSVRYDCLAPLGLSVAEGAKVLDVTRQALNNLLIGRAGISAEMAIRLDKAFGGGAETWLRMQAAARPSCQHNSRRHSRTVQPASFYMDANCIPAGRWTTSQGVSRFKVLRCRVWRLSLPRSMPQANAPGEDCRW